ncbi:uncharacterized protein LOC131598532 [Vicia villosa]|uniref:uncharacterized protein LOC131598532 n=1 Tax=Vicia villosa TaxID=3911 RepID=UPI00273C1C6C|nr:uncharacterized protein LOC131598532 [Vicia villosa]
MVITFTDAQKENFKTEFLEKYFLAYIRSKKEIEFPKLKQGNMSVAYYVSKFEDLSRFYRRYNWVGDKISKCIEFESGLRPEIKQFIRYQEICQFSALVIKCIIYDENICVCTHYKSMNEKKENNQNLRNPYGAPADKGK